jgi:hypothetical protein
MNLAPPFISHIVEPQSQMIAGSIIQVLPDSEIDFGGGHRRMAQSQLNLFQRSMAFMSQLGEGPAQIVGCCGKPDLLRITSDNPIDVLWCQRRPRNPARPIERTENAPAVQPSRTVPYVYGYLCPTWYRDGSKPAVLPQQVCDYPSAFPLLDMKKSEATRF